jgi:GT2 family glycosyltransferase
MTSLSTKQLSIILVNYRSESHLLSCFLSLEGFVRDIDHEILIVNNDKKETLAEVRKNFPQIRLIEQAENIGFGRAVNAGAKVAVGEVLFILNPDTEIISGNLQNIFREFSADKKVGIIGSRIVDNFGQVQPWISGVKKNFWDLVKNNLGLKKSQKIWESLEKTEADWVAATAMFIKRDIFEDLSGFDENIFIYFEDADLCERVKKMDKKVLYFPDFKVKHLSGSSFENKKNQKKHYYASQEYYFEKHCQKWEVFMIKLIRKFFYAL